MIKRSGRKKVKKSKSSSSCVSLGDPDSEFEEHPFFETPDHATFKMFVCSRHTGTTGKKGEYVAIYLFNNPRVGSFRAEVFDLKGHILRYTGRLTKFEALEIVDLFIAIHQDDFVIQTVYE
jgi:hypothetical protein